MTVLVLFWSILAGIAAGAALHLLGGTSGGAIIGGVVFGLAVLICASQTTGRRRVLKIVAALGAWVICLHAGAWAINRMLGDASSGLDGGLTYVAVWSGAAALLCAPLLKKLGLSRRSDQGSAATSSTGREHSA